MVLIRLGTAGPWLAPMHVAVMPSTMAKESKKHAPQHTSDRLLMLAGSS
jgi:hypothetical protein